MDLFETGTAQMSDCGAYRYALTRRWSDHPLMVFVMLNPSTADHESNDPTVERCERRARHMGFGGLHVANLFALRSTDPQALYTHKDPVGPQNDAAILQAVQGAGMVVCAWGTHGKWQNRQDAVLDLLHTAGVQLHCLGLNANGTPKHPLYVSYGHEPQPFKPNP